MIDGPASQPELETYFETRHAHTARRTAEDSNIPYFAVETMDELQETWQIFNETKGTSLLEIKTDPVVDAEGLKMLKQALRS